MDPVTLASDFPVVFETPVAWGDIVTFDYNENRKTALPDSVRRAILELEEG